MMTALGSSIVNSFRCCSIATCDDFDYNYHGGVYLNTKNATDVNHDIEIVGWGVDDDGTPYWRCRNSWGTYWVRLFASL